MQDEFEYEDYESIYDLRFNINYYGADFPIDSLVKRLTEQTIQVPEFQRHYVWRPEEASRFIESILLGLPVPNIFLAKDKYSNKLLIIDGLQRLETLHYFVRGHYEDGKRFALKGVVSPFLNMTFDTLSSEDRLNFENYTIHATIISESDNSNRMFHLFERLNTSGTPLTPQEIRSAIYHGSFNLLLKKLNTNDAWRDLYGKTDNRMYDQELILRFFGIYYDLRHFRGNMKEFLNHFMFRNRMLETISEAEMHNVFFNTIEFIHHALGRTAFILGKTFNSALYDAVMYSGAKGYNIISPIVFKEVFSAIKEDNQFISFTRSATTSRQNLLGRVQYVMSRFKMEDYE